MLCKGKSVDLFKMTSPTMFQFFACIAVTGSTSEVHGAHVQRQEYSMLCVASLINTFTVCIRTETRVSSTGCSGPELCPFLSLKFQSPIRLQIAGTLKEVLLQHVGSKSKKLAPAERHVIMDTSNIKGQPGSCVIIALAAVSSVGSSYLVSTRYVCAILGLLVRRHVACVSKL